ncbi:MAG: aromatic amino acid DMT transporter YddG [Burkholderiaceae bacterium]|nr:aromatic amino acid DMT transporter YddG [Burkholderiaceae bacterium]
MSALKTATAATMIGLIAPCLWGASVSLVRGIAENFGMAQGQCLLYVVATLFLVFLVGMPKFRLMPWKYKIFGIGTANICSICFCLSLYFSDGSTQTMEVGMVNYLWPMLTIVFAILFNGQKARWWIAPGALLSLVGIFWILSGGQFVLDDFIARLMRNPLSYALAFGAAVTSAAYCSMTRAWSHGQNCSTVIFLLDMILFGAMWSMGVGGDPVITTKGVLSVIFGGAAMGVAYAAWTHGMIYGNITVLAIASYFTPVLSCLFASIWIGAELNTTFWEGVSMVVVGSLVCWHATSKRALKEK